MEDAALPTRFQWTFKVAGPLLKFRMVPGKECGERVVFLASGRFPARVKVNNKGGEGIAMEWLGMVFIELIGLAR